MLLRTRGKSLNIIDPIVGRVTRDPNKLDEQSFLICENEMPNIKANSFAGILTDCDYTGGIIDFPVVTNVQTFEHLQEGDIVVANCDGNINTLYRINSDSNTLLATERCNSNCLMCSQPPKDRDDVFRLYSIHQKLIPLIPKNCIELGISGGEPTLLGEFLYKTLETLKDNLPDTEIHLLSNGRTFAWNNLAARLARINYKRLMIGIPVYSDYYLVHDYIVQAEHAFNQTILGLYNLARYNLRIEIRVVLHKISIPRLTRLAKYIYKNLPFAEHVVFMGLEHIGYTPYNMDKLWIDPHDYIDELTEAVEFLSGQGMNVSIYNLQLCILPEKLWKYSRKSISDWKNEFMEVCNNCNKKNECCGLFTWNLKRQSRYIKPFISL